MLRISLDSPFPEYVKEEIKKNKTFHAAIYLSVTVQ